MRLIETVKQALMLKSELYSKVEKDINYKNDSIILIVASVLLSSIGYNGFNIVGILSTIIYLSIGLALWVATIYLVSVKILSIRINVHDFIRCLLIGYCPMIFNIFYLVPKIGIYFSILIFIWTVISIAVVIREIIEQEIGSSILLSAMGAVLYFIIIITFA